MKTNTTGSFTTIASWTRRLSVALLLLTCCPLAATARVETVEIIGAPLVENERVTVRVRATQEGDRPALELTEEDFALTVDGQPLPFNPRDWRSPEESVPPPAWIIVLVDMTGSMNALDGSGVTRLQGAVEAMREFNQQAAQRGGSTQIAIVPFGEPGPGCEGYRVNAEAIDTFLPAGDFKLDNYLDYLLNSSPCASTNLYEPIQQAVRFFEDSGDPRFEIPDENSNLPQPRLAIIVLSDGYHNQPNEERDFQALMQRLQRSTDLTVHTLGYGWTPAELGQRYGLGRPANRDDVYFRRIPEEEFIDPERLADIAQATGGISEFSGRAEEVAASLTLFLDSLLGEYEISFDQPNPERGSRHEVMVTVQSSEGSEPVNSQTVTYLMPAFGRTVPLPIRLGIFSASLALLGLGGVLPLYLWGQHLKEEALEG